MLDHQDDPAGCDGLGVIPPCREAIENRHGFRADCNQSRTCTVANRVVWVDHFFGQKSHPRLDPRIRPRSTSAHLTARVARGKPRIAIILRSILVVRPFALRRLRVAQLGEHCRCSEDTHDQSRGREDFFDPEHLKTSGSREGGDLNHSRCRRSELKRQSRSIATSHTHFSCRPQRALSSRTACFRLE